LTIRTFGIGQGVACRVLTTKNRCVTVMSMYRKYLLKKNFWHSKENTYMLHNERAGGIYAYIQDNGVKIVANNESRMFSNFNDLDLYLDQLMSTTRVEGSEFMQILNRRNTSKLLRANLV
jgi:hypothetical protein